METDVLSAVLLPLFCFVW